jgi:hypothetical protein
MMKSRRMTRKRENNHRILKLLRRKTALIQPHLTSKRGARDMILMRRVRKIKLTKSSRIKETIRRSSRWIRTKAPSTRSRR